MKRFFYTALLLLIVSTGNAQGVKIDNPEVKKIYDEAYVNLNKANYRQAIALLQQAVQMSPATVELHRDLGKAYFLNKDYDKANETLNSVINSGRADEICYVNLSASYAAQKDTRKAKSTLQKGLKQFPNSGMLYREMGLQYEIQEDKESALLSYLDGIEKDPAYPVNYYEAAHTYVFSNKVVWAIIFAEMFINVEQNTARSMDARKMLLGAYKRFYFLPQQANVPVYGAAKHNEEAKTFEEAVEQTLRKLTAVVSDGITTENLIMLRARFITEWRLTYASVYSFGLFDRMDMMLRNGYFDTYNQWLLAKAEDEKQFETWKSQFGNKMNEMQNWMANNKYKPYIAPEYLSRKVKGIFSKK